MSPAADNVICRLDAARQKWWFFTLVTTTVIAVCVSFGTLLVLMLTDAYARFSQITLLVMAAGWLAMTVALVVLVCRRLLRSQRSLEATARRVESEFPELGSNLINLVQLCEDRGGGGRAFRSAAVKEAVAKIGHARFEAAAAKQSAWRRFLYCMQTPRDLAVSVGVLGLLIVAAVLCHLYVANFGSAADRLMNPFTFVPSVGEVEIVEVTPGNTQVILGGSLQIAAVINNPEGRPHKARLFITPEGEEETELVMTADDEYCRYTLTLSSVVNPFAYRLEIGDTQTEIYAVEVVEKPIVAGVEITLHYPAYMNRDPEPLPQTHLDLDAPQYATAELHIRPSVPLNRDPDRGEFRSYIQLGGTAHPHPRVNRIRVRPDRPPTVQLAKPGRQSTAAPGDEISVRIRAGDDYGLRKLRLEAVLKPPETDAEPAESTSAATPVELDEWTEFADRKSTEEVHLLKLDELGSEEILPGQIVLLRAVAEDNREIRARGLEPQETIGGWHTIRIIRPEVQSETELQQIDDIRREVWRILQKQLRARVAEQDFANASMLNELVEIQTEIKMAEGALLKKTADIAVPLEQLGAEMAEEIKTNIEKWLPDTPDRERWSQEESLTDQDKEAPMAELPGELEDLIGELMEEEEDLFDEMEDVSSSAADSLDKGAGWDVADGPISNMSAKGATGNRLPNTSEIGGRSGEGRSGKSSGEFVGNEAVGKGGRKTPSRLTPDPYMKGQIQDHSRDPTGGATGGGKESGQGAGGLEGPAPPGRQRNLQRLAGKQAALRNKAEGVELDQFRITDFHHTDLQNMIDVMAQIERDLKAGRYQNALRQKKVLLDGLGELKQYVEGEFEVRQDASANLPSDIQKELLGAMQDPSPDGWAELNREYFQRLSAGGAAAPEGTETEPAGN